MKFFAVVFHYSDYKECRNHIGVSYVMADDENQARVYFGHSGILTVKEISLDDLVKTGARS